MNCYDRKGNPIPWEEWADTAKDNRVALTDLPGNIRVSTVWLGLDHNFMHDGPPLIFETMVFREGKGHETWRYSTEEEAKEGHEEVVKELKNEPIR